MIISERIFEILKQRGMTQKEFSEKTGIAQSTISDWKRKRTNPVAEKILIICEVLEIPPEELLSGVEEEGRRNRPMVNFTINKESELGMLIVEYQKLDHDARKRLLEYMKMGSDPTPGDCEIP